MRPEKEDRGSRDLFGRGLFSAINQTRTLPMQFVLMIAVLLGMRQARASREQEAGANMRSSFWAGIYLYVHCSRRSPLPRRTLHSLAHDQCFYYILP